MYTSDIENRQHWSLLEYLGESVSSNRRCQCCQK